MATNKIIFPMAYSLAPNHEETIYYLGFPNEWKKTLLAIEKAKNPRFKSEYGLPTIALQKLIDSWMEGIVNISPLKENSDDNKWLSSTIAFDANRISVLFNIIKVWIKATYVSGYRVTPFVAQEAEKLCDSMSVEEFFAQLFEQEICLSFEDSTVSSEAYQAIPLIVVNRLVGKDIEIGDTNLHLLYAGKNELVTSVITDSKSGHCYSLVLQFSVQTTPPERKALLLCNVSMRRWIPGRTENYKGKIPFLQNDIIAHIQTSNNKYCKIPIRYERSSAGLDWSAQDKECYNLYGYRPLPSASEVFDQVDSGNQDILLPWATNGWNGFVRSKIGTGVPVKDKACIYEWILDTLGDILCKPEQVQRVSTRQRLPYYDAPSQYETRESFRQWVSSCTETNTIKFELYGNWADATENCLLIEIEQRIEEDFGEEIDGSSLCVEISRKNIGDMALPIDKNIRQERCDEIVDELGETNQVIGCICVIQGEDDYPIGTDPKAILRNAFARSGRVVQFVVPNRASEIISKEKIEHAVFDLYRQLGITTLTKIDKLEGHSLKNTKCMGVHVFTQVHGIQNKARFMPLFLTYDISTGVIRVQCDAFENDNVNYRQACIEMAKLYWREDLEEVCKNAQFSPMKKKMMELKNRHVGEQNILILVHSDGNTRPLWAGISDKAIGDYDDNAEYVPESIDVGAAKTPYPISLCDTNIRIIRVRDNQEVPDYFTTISDVNDEKYSSASGIFKYGKDYWCISAKPNDKKYNKSLKEMRYDHPTSDYAEKDMVEFYPIQLQEDDDPSIWVKLVADLRNLSIQYNQATILPLPLHLAKSLTEYLLE